MKRSAAIISIAIAGLTATAQSQVASRGREPRPEPAIPAILAAFDTFPIVAIGDMHTDQEIANFVLNLVRHPRFPDVVNHIVIEVTHDGLQSTIDRYVAGEDVLAAEAQKLWRDAMNPAGLNIFASQFFQIVRRINQTLPPAKRLRVIAGEGGADWATMTPEIFTQHMGRREEHIAEVLEREIVAKRRKALMFYGGAHIWHGRKNPQPGWGRAMEIFETRNPGLTFVVFPYVGGKQRAWGNASCGFPLSVKGVDVDARMRLWDVPSLARTKGTWLADVAAEDVWGGAKARTALGGAATVDTTVAPIDAYLYLGPPSLHLAVLPSGAMFADTAYLTELYRRQNLPAVRPRKDPRTDPEVQKSADTSVLACAPAR